MLDVVAGGAETMSLHHPVRVGPAVIPGNLFLAPVAGYSDAAFRSICVTEGADLCYTEMVSSEAFTRGHPRTAELLARAENETSYAIQLFGAKPEVMARAAVMVSEYTPLLIDVNCGCPVPKIVKTGAGSALVRKPALIGEIVRSMVSALEAAGRGSIPVTVKIRTGWDEGSINYLETAARAVDGGAAAVTLHARTREQGYSGKAGWGHIAALSKALTVPVFGSGDVFSGLDAARMIAETGCAGVMIARGAMGDPFIFRDALSAMDGVERPVATIAERAAAAKAHLLLSARFIGERTACVEFRKHFCSYTKGRRGGAELRGEAVKACTTAEFDSLLGRWAELG